MFGGNLSQLTKPPSDTRIKIIELPNVRFPPKADIGNLCPTAPTLCLKLSDEPASESRPHANRNSGALTESHTRLAAPHRQKRQLPLGTNPKFAALLRSRATHPTRTL